MKSSEGLKLWKWILDTLFSIKFSTIHTKNDVDSLNFSLANSEKVNFINVESDSSRRWADIWKCITPSITTLFVRSTAISEPISCWPQAFCVCIILPKSQRASSVQVQDKFRVFTRFSVVFIKNYSLSGCYLRLECIKKGWFKKKLTKNGWKLGKSENLGNQSFDQVD